ncbi:MAG: hypothetical protein ACTSWU_00850 [Candidatus Thorarchaeota archaeon]
MTRKSDRSIEEVILDNNPLEKMLRDFVNETRRERLDNISVTE